MPVYDPTNNKISWGIPLNAGIADNTFVKVSRNEASASLQSGSDGTAVITRMHNKTGKAELTVQRASAVNAYLSAQLTAWEEGEGGVLPFFVKDLDGESIVIAEQAVLEKPADFERAKEHGNATWTFLLTNVTIFNAGIDA